MHFSAKRGLAIACRLSVCLWRWLVNCDHIGWNSSEIISPLVSMGCSLSVDPNIRVYSKGNTAKFWPKVTHPGYLSVGDIRSLIATNGTLQIAQRSVGHNGEPIGNHHRIFEWCHRWPPKTPPSPKMGFHMPQDTRMAISPQRLIRSTYIARIARSSLL